MLHVVEAPSEDVVAVTLEEGETMVVVVMVTSPTSPGINFLYVSCVAGLTNRCSNAIRDLIQILWEKNGVQMQPIPMVWIQIGMQIQGS
jgi:hypothetical protein